MSHPTAYSSTVFVPLPPQNEIRKALGAHDPDKTLNVVKMFAGTDNSMFHAITSLTGAVCQTDGIDARMRGLMMLRVAKVLNVPYEWQVNAKIGVNAGLTRKDIEAAASEETVQGIDLKYVLLCKATDELTCYGTLLDQTLDALLSNYGVAITRKLILTIAWFNMLGRFVNGCRVPLETTDKIGDKTSPI